MIVGACIFVTPATVAFLLYLLRVEKGRIIPDLYMVAIVAGVALYGLVSGLFLNKVLKKSAAKLEEEIKYL